MAMDLHYAAGNNVTITNTETSLAVDGGSTTLQTLTAEGLYQLFLSGKASMVKGDEFTLRFYEKAEANAAKEIFLTAILSDAQSEMLVSPEFHLGAGWDITLQRTAGSDRAFYWTIRRVS